METFSALLALCAGISLVPVNSQHKGQWWQSFDVFFDLCLNTRLSKQPWSWWFETPAWSLWRHRNGIVNTREINQYNALENYTFKINATFPKRQWVEYTLQTVRNRRKSGVAVMRSDRYIFCTWHHSSRDDVIKWKYFPRYWSFVWWIHRSLVNSPHKGKWRGALMFSLFCVWISGWVNNREAGDLRRYRAHYDVNVMVVSCAFFLAITLDQFG